MLKKVFAIGLFVFCSLATLAQVTLYNAPNYKGFSI